MNLNEDSYQKIKDKLLAYIAYRARSKYELSTKVTHLLRKYDLSKYEEREIVDKLLEFVESLSLVDDLDFAKTYIRDKLGSSKPVSKHSLTSFLMRKGVSRTDIERVFTEYEADFPSEARLDTRSIEIFADKKLNSLQKLPYLVKKKKLITYLASKGYRLDDIYAVVDTKIKVN